MAFALIINILQLIYREHRPGAGKKAARKAKFRTFVGYCCGTITNPASASTSDKIGPTYFPLVLFTIKNRVLSI